MFEKKIHIDALFELYGGLLTDKQSEIMDLYCNMDYSLGEISELLSISRQAVHDAIKKAEKSLEKYEEKLGLMKRLEDKTKILERVRELVIQYEDTHQIACLEQIKSLVEVEME